MDNNMVALLKLYIALGGNLTDTYEDIANGIPVSDYTIKPDIIEAIAQKVAGAGIELPVVSKTDNGDVLTVVNGAWAKANIPSQLPAVTASDNGSVLKVVDGAWAVAEDAVE